MKDKLEVTGLVSCYEDGKPIFEDRRNKFMLPGINHLGGHIAHRLVQLWNNSNSDRSIVLGVGLYNVAVHMGQGNAPTTPTTPQSAIVPLVGSIVGTPITLIPQYNRYGFSIISVWNNIVSPSHVREFMLFGNPLTTLGAGGSIYMNHTTANVTWTLPQSVIARIASVDGAFEEFMSVPNKEYRITWTILI